MKSIVTFLLFYSHIAFAQSPAVLNIIDEIEFKEDTVKSVFLWIAENMSYDVSLIETEEARAMDKEKFLQSQQSNDEYRLLRAIELRKGVCQEFALLFDELIQELGYESYRVIGYTKNRKGVIDSTGHVWNALKIDGEWKLFDVTWASGHLKKGRVVKQFNKNWYDVDPKEMLETHIPFDPLWQLLDDPITYNEFEQLSLPMMDDREYITATIIDDLISKEEPLQLEEMLSRSEQLGPGNYLVHRWMKSIKTQLLIYEVTRKKRTTDKAIKTVKNTAVFLDYYQKAKSGEFKEHLGSRENARRKLKRIKKKVEEAISIFSTVEPDPMYPPNFNDNNVRELKRMLFQINKELVNN